MSEEDICNRLRDDLTWRGGDFSVVRPLSQAALDEITRLRAKVTAMEKVLRATHYHVDTCIDASLAAMRKAVDEYRDRDVANARNED